MYGCYVPRWINWIILCSPNANDLLHLSWNSKLALRMIPTCWVLLDIRVSVWRHRDDSIEVLQVTAKKDQIIGRSKSRPCFEWCHGVKTLRRNEQECLQISHLNPGMVPIILFIPFFLGAQVSGLINLVAINLFLGFLIRLLYTRPFQVHKIPSFSICETTSTTLGSSRD